MPVTKARSTLLHGLVRRREHVRLARVQFALDAANDEVVRLGAHRAFERLDFDALGLNGNDAVQVRLTEPLGQ
jgi:hypothetical protein